MTSIKPGMQREQSQKLWVLTRKSAGGVLTVPGRVGSSKLLGLQRKNIFCKYKIKMWAGRVASPGRWSERSPRKRGFVCCTRLQWVHEAAGRDRQPQRKRVGSSFEQKGYPQGRGSQKRLEERRSHAEGTDFVIPSTLIDRSIEWREGTESRRRGRNPSK